MAERDVTQTEAAYLEAVATLERLARAGTPLPHAPPEHDAPAEDDSPAPPAAEHRWSEKTYRALIEALPDAVVVVDRAGAIAVVNAQTEAMFGYRRDELLGQPVELLIPQRFRRGHVEHRGGYFAAPHGRPMGAGLHLLGRRRAGGEFPVEVSLSPLQTEEGTFATAVIRDVSDREREEAKFRTLVETIPAVTFFAPLDESAPRLYVSPQIEQLLGFSQKEWLEDPVLWHRQLHPEDRDRWNVQFAPTCGAGAAFQSVYRFIAKDGRVVWVHGSASLVRDGEGRPIFLQGVAFDVTAIKEAEEALERRVRERTAELAESMGELQEKTEELEKFAYVASHDLREPLRSLVNWPQKLAREYAGKLDGQADAWLGKVIQGAERMRRLIDDLSKYARVLRRDRQFAAVDCNVVLSEACANLQAALEESAAEVVTQPLPKVTGNQAQLTLLLQNLVGNAIKFRDAGRRPRVEVGAQPREGGWLLWVRDNGIGIEPKYLKRIFELGERLHSAARYPGTGFGLAICEKIVRGHGGLIWATSEPGAGSAFYFTLPPGPPGS